jgi:hypothetical protein
MAAISRLTIFEITTITFLMTSMTFCPTTANALRFIQNDETPLYAQVSPSSNSLPIGDNQTITIKVLEQSDNISKGVPMASISGVIINSSESGMIPQELQKSPNGPFSRPVQSSFQALTDDNGIYKHRWTIGQQVKPGSYSVIVYVSADGYRTYLTSKQFYIKPQQQHPNATTVAHK